MDRKLGSTLLSIFLFLAVFGSGYDLGRSGYRFFFSRNPLRFSITRVEQPELVDKEHQVDLSLFWKVWDLLQQEYLRKDTLSKEQLMYGAISGLARSVGDPYTAFLNPQENEVVKSGINGEYEGIGAELGMKENQLVIIAPLEGSPAEQAGVMAGDKIYKINGEDTSSITLSEAVSKIRGKKGTVVKLTLGRDSRKEPFDVSITRGRITLESVKWEEKGDGIFYIRISQFGERTYAEWRDAVDKILDKSFPRAVIIDLRNNPGGILNVSVEIASEFIDRGVIVIQEDAAGRQKVFKSTHLGRFTSVPIVLLLNGGSASASEILASALRVQRQAKLVGTKSFGKGTVQDARDLEGGSGVHITVARWLAPDGTCVDGVGITPDYEVEITEEDIKSQRDPQLKKAIEVAKSLIQ